MTDLYRQPRDVVALMAERPEILCRTPGCAHIAGAHETTDDEPGPCWHADDEPPCPCDRFSDPVGTVPVGSFGFIPEQSRLW